MLKPLTHVHNLDHATKVSLSDFLATLKGIDFIAWTQYSDTYHCNVMVILTGNGESVYNANNCNNALLLNIVNHYAI